MVLAHIAHPGDVVEGVKVWDHGLREGARSRTGMGACAIIPGLD